MKTLPHKLRKLLAIAMIASIVLSITMIPGMAESYGSGDGDQTEVIHTAPHETPEDNSNTPEYTPDYTPDYTGGGDICTDDYCNVDNCAVHNGNDAGQGNTGDEGNAGESGDNGTGDTSGSNEPPPIVH